MVEVIHMQEAKRRKGTSLMGWRTGQRMLEVRKRMPREMVEAKMVRGMCLRKWAWLHCYLLNRECKKSIQATAHVWTQQTIEP